MAGLQPGDSPCTPYTPASVGAGFGEAADGGSVTSYAGSTDAATGGTAVQEDVKPPSGQGAGSQRSSFSFALPGQRQQQQQGGGAPSIGAGASSSAAAATSSTPLTFSSQQQPAGGEQAAAAMTTAAATAAGLDASCLSSPREDGTSLCGAASPGACLVSNDLRPDSASRGASLQFGGAAACGDWAAAVVAAGSGTAGLGGQQQQQAQQGGGRRGWQSSADVEGPSLERWFSPSQLMQQVPLQQQQVPSSGGEAQPAEVGAIAGAAAACGGGERQYGQGAISEPAAVAAGALGGSATEGDGGAGGAAAVAQRRAAELASRLVCDLHMSPELALAWCDHGSAAGGAWAAAAAERRVAYSRWCAAVLLLNDAETCGQLARWYERRQELAGLAGGVGLGVGLAGVAAGRVQG